MKKSYAAPFAIAGAAMTAVLLAVLNLMTTPGVLWCIYPIYGLAWWPIGVALCTRHKYMAFSVTGSLMTIAFLAAVNLITSPQTLWFLYTVPLLLCWPLAMHFRKNLIRLYVAELLSVLIIGYFTAVNLLITPGHFWAIYPIFAVLWWPMGLYFNGRKAYRQYSVAGAVLTIAFLIASNLLTTSYPWALYACFPVLWWPLAMYFGKKLGAFKFSILCSVITDAYYCALNVLLAPGCPWVMFIVFALLWWPLSVYFYGKRRPDVYASVMAAISIAFFAAVNMIFSPGAVWALYPAFPILWWPITLLFARKKAWLGYSIAASVLSIAFFAAVNLLTSPGFAWFLFPSMAILWWPLAVSFKGRHKPFGFAIAGAALVIGTLAIINLLTSPGFLWFLFPALAILWWPAAVLFAKKRNPFGFSIVGSLLVIVLLASINLLTSSGFLWFLFPAFLVLWWPLSVYFFSYRRHRLAE